MKRLVLVMLWCTVCRITGISSLEHVALRVLIENGFNLQNISPERAYTIKNIIFFMDNEKATDLLVLYVHRMEGRLKKRQFDELTEKIAQNMHMLKPIPGGQSKPKRRRLSVRQWSKLLNTINECPGSLKQSIWDEFNRLKASG